MNNNELKILQNAFIFVKGEKFAEAW